MARLAWFNRASALAIALAFGMALYLAIDFGGVLRWSQYLAGIVIVIASVLALPAAFQRSLPLGRLLLGILPLVIWAAYAGLQCLPVSIDVLRWLSPGVASCYQDWSEPLLVAADKGTQGDSQPVSYLSVMPWASAHWARWIAILIPLVILASHFFIDRRRLDWMLVGVVSVVGAHLAYAGLTVWSPEFGIRSATGAAGDTGFGAFVNRNHVALHLNLGLAAGFGLVVVELQRIAQMRRSGVPWQGIDLLAVITRWRLILGAIAVVACACGLVYCGSRSGLLAALAGLACMLAMIRIGGIGWVLTGACILLVVLVSMVSSGWSRPTTLNRFETGDLKHASILTEDSRWPHWQDALVAAWAYAPTGAGMGSYADANLPYQTESSGLWFQHADNMYIELVVELGVVGVLVILMMIALVAGAIFRLGRSEQALDKGLCAMTAYAFGATLVSQCFDFGAIIPANLVLLCLLVAACYSRAWAFGQQHERSAGRSDSIRETKPATTWRQRSVTLTPMVLASLVVALVLVGMRRDAWAEFQYRDQVLKYETAKLSPPELSELYDQATILASNDSLWRHEPELANLLSVMAFQKTRFAELSTLDVSLPEMIPLYRQSSLETRRLQSDQWPETVDVAADFALASGGYRESVQWACQTLRVRPLDLQARVTLVCLDFYHRDAELSELALKQLLSLQQGTARPLMDLADLALGSKRFDLAQQAMGRALIIEPRYVREAIEQSVAHPTLELDAIIPLELECRRQAVQQILGLIAKTPTLRGQYQSFLAASLQALQVDQADGLEERIACLKSRVQLGFFLEEPELAIASANQLAEEGGADVNTHVSFLKMMQQAERIPEAIAHAELVLKSAPGSKRLREQLKTLYLLDALR